jgi:hypothetical protein
LEIDETPTFHGSRRIAQHTALQPKPEPRSMHSTPPPLKAGGVENGAPGLRRPNYYAAFVLDPEGNNIEAAFIILRCEQY